MKLLVWGAGAIGGTLGAHLVRAALEALAYQSRDVLEAMTRDAGVIVDALRVDGGATANDFLCQFQADVMGASVVRPAVIETTALGAAYAAGLAVSYWASSADLRSNWQEDKRWSPSWSEDERATGYAGCQKAVQRTLDWGDGS